MTWADVEKAWGDLWESTATGWKLLYQEATAAYADLVQAEPEKAAQQVEAYLAELAEARKNLDAIQAKLPNPPQTAEEQALVQQYQEMEKRYHELAAGFYTDTAPLNQTQTGIVPILAVAGLAVGVGAASWSFAAYEYAANLREQTALASKELDARVEASKEGRTLQASTVPAPADPITGARSVGLLLMGGLALAAGALTIPVLMKRK